MEKILTFGLICPFWTSFRNPSTVNVHVTYPFPPPTTLYGMLNAARGMRSDWHEDREAWQFALVIKCPGKLVETFSKIMQTSRSDQNPNSLYDTNRKTVIRQKIVGAHYLVYIKSSDILLEEAQAALMDPYWSLYLGESDDVVDVDSPEIVEVDTVSVEHIHSIIPIPSILPGLVEGCRLIKVPSRFIKQGESSWRVEQQLYSIPPEGEEGIQLSEPKLAYPIEGRNIVFNGNSR